MRKSARASLRCGGLCGPRARLHSSCWRKKPDRAEAPGPHERVLQRLFSRNNRGQAALSLSSFMLSIVFFSHQALCLEAFPVSSACSTVVCVFICSLSPLVSAKSEEAELQACVVRWRQLEGIFEIPR